MKFHYWAFGYVSAIMLISSCGASNEVSCEHLLNQIELMEQALLEGGEEINVDLRTQIMQSYAEFANSCHDHEFTPEALFRRADLLRSAGAFQEAMTQLRDIHDNFANYENRSVCAFLVGFIAEVELNDREQAKKTYQQVVELHPDSDAAKWALQSLQNLKLAKQE